jgi:hypothetical protein
VTGIDDMGAEVRGVSASEFLDKTELHHLTGAARAKAQAEWLRSKAIPHQVDGCRVIVCRGDVRDWVQGKAVAVSSGDFNWGSVR